MHLTYTLYLTQLKLCRIRHYEMARERKMCSRGMMRSRCLKQPTTKTLSGSRSRTQPLASVFFQEKDVTPDPKLFEKVSECDRRLAIARHQECPLAHLSPELSDIFDFFIALTICNTVVVTSPDQPRQKASSEVPP